MVFAFQCVHRLLQKISSMALLRGFRKSELAMAHRLAQIWVTAKAVMALPVAPGARGTSKSPAYRLEGFGFLNEM